MFSKPYFLSLRLISTQNLCSVKRISLRPILTLNWCSPNQRFVFVNIWFAKLYSSIQFFMFQTTQFSCLPCPCVQVVALASLCVSSLTWYTSIWPQLETGTPTWGQCCNQLLGAQVVGNFQYSWNSDVITSNVILGGKTVEIIKI